MAAPGAGGYAGGAPPAVPISATAGTNFPGLGGVGMVDEKDLGLFGLKKGKDGTPQTADQVQPPAGSGKGSGTGQPAAPPAQTQISDSAKAMMERAKDLEKAEQMEDSGEDEVPSCEEATKLLEAFQADKGVEAAARVFGNLLKVLERLADDPKNVKLHKMRLDVLQRILDGGELVPVLELGGFEKSDEANGIILKWSGAGKEESDPAYGKLKSVVRSAQKASDALMDPDKVDFQTVMKLVSANRTLPGIQDVDDKVPERKEAKAAEMVKPMKPWEKKAAEAAAKAAEGGGGAEKKEDADAKKEDGSAK